MSFKDAAMTQMQSSTSTKKSGFTLVEVAIIVIIIGIIAALTIPAITSRIVMDRGAQGLVDVISVRDEIIGFAMSQTPPRLPRAEVVNGVLTGQIHPADLAGLPQAQAGDFWGQPFMYRVNPALTSNLCGAAPVDLKIARGGVAWPPDPDEAAFIIKSNGPNMRSDVPNFTLAHPLIVPAIGAMVNGHAFDDIVEFVTFGYLRERFDDLCTTASELTLNSPGSALFVAQDGEVHGSVHGYSVVLRNHARVTGDVISRQDVRLATDSQVNGNICAVRDVRLENQTIVDGDIHAHRNVVLAANNSVVRGSIYATGNVTLENGAVVHGHIHAGGNVTLNRNNTVQGSVVAGGNITLNNTSTINGNATAGGNITLNNWSRINGNATAGGNITLNNWSRINGNATAGGSITILSNSSITGTQTPNAPPPITSPIRPQDCPAICMPDHATITPGTTDITVTGTTPIAPGDYRNLTVNQNGIIELSAGTYHFNSIRLGTGNGNNAGLDLDLTAGDITIFVRGDVSFGENLRIRVNTGGGYQDIVVGGNLVAALKPLAARIYLETLGSFSMGRDSQWFGTIYAQHQITFNHDSLLVGSYHSADRVRFLGTNTDVHFVESNYARNNWVYSCP
jgi:predicted acyltransferase (DUF342 family)/competence protein ComGC